MVLSLQWGRDVSIPEMPDGMLVAPNNTCFNGAGMFPSQKSEIHLSLQPLKRWLQWGRDGSIPEIRKRRWMPASRACFNGAGIFPSHKCVKWVQTPSKWFRFNGAG